MEIIIIINKDNEKIVLTLALFFVLFNNVKFWS